MGSKYTIEKGYFDYYAQENPLSMIQQQMQDHLNKLRKDFDNHLKAYLIRNLQHIGYTFANDNEFIEFVKNRVYRISTESRPNYYELRLDFVDKDNMGTYIGCYSDEINFFEEKSGTYKIMQLRI